MRSAAIRPVPVHARLSAEALLAAEQWLGGESDAAEHRLGGVFDRFERKQPVLADRLGNAMAATTDEAVLALGYFLVLAVWVAFEQSAGARLDTVTHTALSGVEQALDLDQQLRRADPAEAVDTEAVIAMEQPEAASFINDHIDAALEVLAGTVDVEAVHRMYRLALVELLALSYAVGGGGEDGHGVASCSELQA